MLPCGYYAVDVAVYARSQYHKAKGDVFLLGGEECNIVIPPTLIVISLTVFAIV